MSASASTSPATTVDRGPLTAATATRSPCRAISGRTSSTGSDTDNMPPRRDNASSTACDRNATTRAASCRLNAPATAAAAISPCECPTTACGSTPYERHTSASDTMTAHSTGCTTSTWSSSSSSLSTSTSDQLTNGRSASSHSAIRRANTSSVASSSRPMPTHCEPWPGNTNAALPAAVTCPVTTSSPMITARWSKLARAANVNPTSTGSASTLLTRST